MKRGLTGKASDAEKDWGQEEKGAIEDKMVRWHHRLDGHEFEQTPGARWEKSPGEGNGNPLQYSCLENPIDRGTWWSTVHGVAKSWTRLSDLWIDIDRNNLSSLPGSSVSKESACNSGDWCSNPGLGRYPWRRGWQPTLVFLPGKFHGQRSLVS